MYAPASENQIPTTQDYIDVLKCIDPEQRPRRVRFSSTVLESNSPRDMNDVRGSWYSASELFVFKRQVRMILRGLLPEEKERRGLEFACPQRQKHRYMTIRCTLSAARRGLSPDQIESVSRKCTKWNEEVAVLQACHDFCHVYNPQMASTIPSANSSPPEFPFAVKRSSDPGFSRRVRQRVSPMQ